jgi:OPA family glycerol-3-phosphate transporter-like MFS transporter
MTELIPIAALLVVIALVDWRLPKVALGHSRAFKLRRFQNWFPVGVTYAFLYMGRYNLNVCKTALGDNLMSKADFGTIFFWGTLTYGVSFIINGPLTDRFGGRVTMLVSAIGSAATNAAMGLFLASHPDRHSLFVVFAMLYAANMYFQSFGAVSIVKLNAPWFHVRERGGFGGIFGILISLGLYFAWDWGGIIVKKLPTEWVFYIPSMILIGMAVIVALLVRDSPSQAGHAELNTGDATDDSAPQMSFVQVGWKLISNPVILTIALVEFCSGYLRNAILQWFPIFARDTHDHGFVASHWGLMSCIAGILGGVFAGFISDRVFNSRRGPVSAVLYGGMILGALAMIAFITTPALGWLLAAMSMCIIGVHGMLSGTASMDFGGKKNAGVAVGIIDGFVYLGVALEGLILGRVTPAGDAKADPANWWSWPVVILPAALIGFALALRVWNAAPKKRALSIVREDQDKAA